MVSEIGLLSRCHIKSPFSVPRRTSFCASFKGLKCKQLPDSSTLEPKLINGNAEGLKNHLNAIHSFQKYNRYSCCLMRSHSHSHPGTGIQQADLAPRRKDGIADLLGHYLQHVSGKPGAALGLGAPTPSRTALLSPTSAWKAHKQPMNK